MKSLWAELKRRKVIQVAIAYAIVAWLLIQIIVSVEAPLHLPDWSDTLLIVVLVVLFPVALILAWAYDLTPGGIRLTPSATDDPAETPSKTVAAVAQPAEQSIAVLPFANMSSDPEQEYFSDGVAEELLNQLTKLRGLHVAGRTSSFYFKGRNEDLRTIGQKLHVAHILEGSVRKSGNRVRITAQLIKASDGYHLWSETFDRDLDDIFAIQDETARAVARALSVTLGVGDVELGAGSTRNFAAYDAYLAGLALRRQEGARNIEAAIERFETAIRLDPDFGNAWAQLSLACGLAADAYIPERAVDYHPRADRAALRAAAIAPDAMAAQLATGRLHARHRRWREAESSLERALQIAPSDPDANMVHAMFLNTVGRPTEAVRCLEMAVRAEPLDLNAARNLGNALEFAGDLDGALAQMRRTDALPGDHLLSEANKAVIGMTLGDRELIRNSLAPMSGSMAGGHKGLTESMLALLESPDEALATLRAAYADPALDRGWRFIVALWGSYLGDHDLALEAYLQSFRSGFGTYFLIWRPLHKEMRRLPGFKDLLRELGIVDYWRSTGNWGEFCRPLGEDDFECYR